MDAPSLGRPRILILSSLTNPEWVSVPLEGYREYERLREIYSTHLITTSNNAPALRRAGIPDLEATYVDFGAFDVWYRKFVNFIFKGDYGSQALTLMSIPLYWLYEIVAWRRLKHRLKAGEFALVHRLTPVSPTMGSPFPWLMRGLKVPFTVGPLNGGLPWPRGYPSAAQEKEAVGTLRKLFPLLPFVGSTFKRARCVITGSSFTWLEAARITPEDKVFFIHENGIPRADVIPVDRPPPVGKVKACFIGRLVPYKNCNLTIKAAAPLIQQGLLELEIIGDGIERENLKALVQSLQIGDGVTFHGALPHKKAMEQLGKSHILAFPSIREFGGGVVVEAMARGLVPIVMKYGGPGDIVDDDSGYRLALTDEETTIIDLRNVLSALCHDKNILAKKSQMARSKAELVYTWESKTALIAQVIDYALGRAPAPALKPTAEQKSQYQP